MLLLSALAVCGLIGLLIGSQKGNGLGGLILGLLFGPLGWLFVALTGDSRPKCPHCFGPRKALEATRCMHCGGELEPILPEHVDAPPSLQKYYDDPPEPEKPRPAGEPSGLAWAVGLGVAALILFVTLYAATR